MRNKIVKKLRKAARYLKETKPQIDVKKTTNRLKKIHMQMPKADRYYTLTKFLINAKLGAQDGNNGSDNG